MAQTKLDVPTQSKFAYLETKYQSELNFGTFSGCKELSFAAPGLFQGASLAYGWPSQLPQNVIGIMYSADNSVVVRLCSFETQASVQPMVFSVSTVRF
jgi:hypothetical protein